MTFPPGIEASHQFEDVPDSSPYHESIAWLVNAGITVGCNVAPPLDCPQASVTREHMAVFLRRAAQTYQVIDANGLMVGRMLRFNDHSATVTFQWRGVTHNTEVGINGFLPVGTFFFLDNLTCSGTAYGDERSVAGDSTLSCAREPTSSMSARTATCTTCCLSPSRWCLEERWSRHRTRAVPAGWSCWRPARPLCRSVQWSSLGNRR